MPDSHDTRKALEGLKNTHQTLTAVFAIIVGRNRAKFDPEFENLKKLNPNGHFTFIEADCSLIKNVDAACERIEAEAGGIDLLFESQGYVGLSGREENADGLDNSYALRYYSRIRFAQNLASAMSGEARVINVLAGGKENKLVESDLDLKTHHSIMNIMKHSATLTTLSFDHLAAQYPDKAFIHAYPGFVKTSTLSKNSKGFAQLVVRVFELVPFIWKKPEVVGERMLYLATSPRFAKGCYIINSEGFIAQENNTLRQYRRMGFAEKVWKHNTEIFQKATAVAKTG